MRAAANLHCGAGTCFASADSPRPTRPSWPACTARPSCCRWLRPLLFLCRACTRRRFDRCKSPIQVECGDRCSLPRRRAGILPVRGGVRRGVCPPALATHHPPRADPAPLGWRRGGDGGAAGGRGGSAPLPRRRVHSWAAAEWPVPGCQPGARGRAAARDRRCWEGGWHRLCHRWECCGQSGLSSLRVGGRRGQHHVGGRAEGDCRRRVEFWLRLRPAAAV